MNKNGVKTFAIWARKELISKVSQKAYEYGASKDNFIDKSVDSIDGRLLSMEERNMRMNLISEIRRKGFEQVMEEAAYTWFNRLIALRYMEVNNYLPDRVRIFTDENNEFKPQIISEAVQLDLPGLDKGKLFKFIEQNNTEELYKYLLITTCNNMQTYLPGVFGSLSSYVQILCPDGLLKDDSVIAHMIHDIDLDSWSDQVQIIGWLYQYYVSEKHDQVVDMNGKAIAKEDIPAATQLFTTDWVVKYMVDNSLGRYWIERHPESHLEKELEFFVKTKNGHIDYVNEKISPEDLTFIDPCMGSGHILVYAFDVLMKIYISEGWNSREAAISILKNNIYGLDIDERAYQLSSFALMMKARQYNRKILFENIELNIMAMQESNDADDKLLYKFGKELEPSARIILDIFNNAKEYGSIIQVPLTEDKINELAKKLDEIDKMADYGNLLVQAESAELVSAMHPLIKQAKILAKKYNAIANNPPYMNKFSPELKEYIGKYFCDYKSDLFSVFMYRNFNMAIKGGYLGFMTPMVWMFIKSYESLRDYIIREKNIATLIQFEYSAYEEATVPICSFVLKNIKDDSLGKYFRLSDFKGGMDVQRQKVLEAIVNPNQNYYFEIEADNFSKIPGNPIAYWNRNFLVFDGQKLGDYYESGGRTKTHDNTKYLRLWYEVDALSQKWEPYANGGDFRKWYGNNYYVVNWSSEARKSYDSHGGLYNIKYWGKTGICWNLITSASNGFRIKNSTSHYSSGSPTLFSENNNLDCEILGYLNSSVVKYFLNMFNPTINTTVNDVLKLPYRPCGQASELVKNNILISTADWNSFEISQDFEEHPLLKNKVNAIKKAYTLWESESNDRFNTLKNNEEELNRIFIDIYGLNDELMSEVEDKDVTIRKADFTRDIKSLISYAVGCMFGRYSLDTKGLAYAGGEWNKDKYLNFIPDENNILPIMDSDYFKDDIANKFVNFIATVYGKESLEENLTFIATALGGNGSSREIIRNYFLNDFFKDHCNIYQVTGSGKRPIYWLFDAGKNNSFKCLVYMHRYQPDLIARIRTDYILPHQTVLRNKADTLDKEIKSTTTTSEKIKLQKQLSKVSDQINELRIYEEKIHHYADQMISIDLDDGVKVNYAKFGDLLAKIK